MSHNTRKSAIMPLIPDGFVVVAPDDPGCGYLQICREGADRVLCGLPIQPTWHLRQMEEFEKFLVCLECLKTLETLPKPEPAEAETKLLTAEEIETIQHAGAAWLGEETFVRLMATLDALMAERDEWRAAADEWCRAYEEAIGG